MNTSNESFLIFKNDRQVIRADNLLCNLQIRHFVVPVPSWHTGSEQECIVIKTDDKDDLITLFKEEGFICSCISE